MSSSPRNYHSNSSSAAPVFTPAFGADHGGFDDDEVDERLAFGLSLDSPPAYVFSNDLAFEPSDAALHGLDADETDMGDHHDTKAAAMRSVPTQRDTSAFGFEPLITPRSFESGFVETNVFESASGKAPVFVLDQVLPSPLNVNGAKSFDFFTPTILKSSGKDLHVPSSPLSPAGFVEIPEKERNDFYFSVNPAFTSVEAPAKIMDTVKTALATLPCQYETSKHCQWTLDVRCMLVAEEISFAIHLLQIRGATTKYEVEFARRGGDELVFVDLAEHIRAQCSDVDEDGALALFNKSLDAWMDAKQELVGRRFAIKETEAITLLDELNCEFLQPESLYEVARSVKNHCRHKGNRKLFAQSSDARKNLIKGLKWMLADSDELARYALFVLQQYAGDEEHSATFFPTPFEKSSVSLLLDGLDARKEDQSPFTSEMVDAVRRSALFA